MVARLGILLAVALATACGGRDLHPWEYQPVAMADTVPIYEPAEARTSLAYDQIYGVFTGMGRMIDLNRHFGGLPPALNADPFDGVVNSAWFTNRNQVDPLTPDEIFRGPQSSQGPDQSGPVKVWDIKTQGISPGFWIQDASGDRYIVKLDPVDYPEINSAAEVISTNLLWASGYNLPENYVAFLDLTKLEFDEEEELELTVAEDDRVVTYQLGAEDPARELTMDVFLRRFFDGYPRRPDGTVRVLASKFLSGTPVGPLAWEETRFDDPNDVIPHQDRREIRGLYVLAAWLNHVDTKQGNTLDMFIESEASPEGDDAPKIGYVRHNLIDVGSTLGSGTAHPHNPRHGTEFDFDAGSVFLRFLTFGMYKRPWQRMMPYPETLPSTGYYSVENFDPADWRSNIVNPAFINRTARDGYWGAKIVMSFTDEQLQAAVQSGQYSDPAATAYVFRALQQRRDATGRYWFAKVSPLENPRVEGNALTFDDLWQRYFGGNTEYRWRFDWDAPDPDVSQEGVASQPRIPLPDAPAALPAERRPEDAYARLRVWKVAGGDEAPRPAVFWLEWSPAARSWSVVGARY